MPFKKNKQTNKTLNSIETLPTSRFLSSWRTASTVKANLHRFLLVFVFAPYSEAVCGLVPGHQGKILLNRKTWS